jgi:hypothetical protein
MIAAIIIALVYWGILGTLCYFVFCDTADDEWSRWHDAADQHHDRLEDIARSAAATPVVCNVIQFRPR